MAHRTFYNSSVLGDFAGSDRRRETHGRGRICKDKKCGTHLSVYNKNDYCFSCLSKKIMSGEIEDLELDRGGTCRKRKGLSYRNRTTT